MSFLIRELSEENANNKRRKIKSFYSDKDSKVHIVLPMIRKYRRLTQEAESIIAESERRQDGIAAQIDSVPTLALIPDVDHLIEDISDITSALSVGLNFQLYLQNNFKDAAGRSFRFSGDMLRQLTDYASVL
jgi:hypothetical protein